MRFFLTENLFLSVIKQEGGLSCQVMALVYGIGMYPARINSPAQEVVSCVVHEHDVIKQTSRVCKTIEEVARFHEELMLLLL